MSNDRDSVMEFLKNCEAENTRWRHRKWAGPLSLIIDNMEKGKMRTPLRVIYQCMKNARVIQKRPLNSTTMRGVTRQITELGYFLDGKYQEQTSFPYRYHGPKVWIVNDGVDVIVRTEPSLQDEAPFVPERATSWLRQLAADHPQDVVRFLAKSLVEQLT